MRAALIESDGYGTRRVVEPVATALIDSYVYSSNPVSKIMELDARMRSTHVNVWLRVVFKSFLVA